MNRSQTNVTDAVNAANVIALPIEADASTEPVPLPPSLSPTPAIHLAPQPVSRRSFLMRSGYGIAGLLALSQWEGVGITPTEARGAIGRMAAMHLSATLNSRLSLPFWADAVRFDDSHYWSTMQSGRRQAMKTYTYCDFDGDGREELLIRSPAGIEIVQWHAENAQWMPFPGDTTALKDFNDDNAYDPQYGFTLGTADIDRDGRHEIVGRFADGLRVYRYDLNTQAWSKLTTCDRFDDVQGWNTNVAYYQTIQYGDIDGDKQDEVIARGGGGIYVWKYKNGAWSQIAESDQFSDSGNWGNTQYWGTIQLADVDGDHAKELITRSGTGLEVWKLNTSVVPNILESKGTLTAWSDPYGWDAPAQYSTIQCGDLDGDGVDEIFGNGIDGLEAFKFHIGTGIGDGTFTLMAPRLADTSSQYGWGSPSQYFTFHLADIDGDGAREVIARAGQVGIMTFKYNTGTQVWDRFHDDSDINRELSDGNGWGDVQYYATFQSTHVLLPGDTDYTGDGTHPQAIVLGRSSTGVPCYRWDKPNNAWAPCRRDPPAFTGGQAAAYQALPAMLGVETANGNIRSQYNDLTAPISEWMADLYAPPYPNAYDTPVAQRPAPLLKNPDKTQMTITDADWAAVTWQIYFELQWITGVNKWYGLTSTLITDTFLGNSTILPIIGNYMQLSNNAQVALNILAVIGNAAWAILGAPEVGLGTASAISGFLATAAGAGASFMRSAGGAVQTAYSNWQDTLNLAFNAAKTGNTQNQNYVTGGTIGGLYVPADYGLLKMMGENIHSGVWAWTNNPDAVAAAQRGYALGCWQAMISAGWELNLEGPDQPTGTNYSYKGSDNNYRRIIENNPAPLIRHYIPDSTLAEMFDPISPGSSLPLGVPLADVFLGQHGWPVLTTYVYHPRGSTAPTSLNSDIRVFPVLTRDTTTGNVVVTIELANRGLSNAGNVRLTSVQLGNKSGLPNTTHVHRFLRSNFPEVLHVRLSGLSSGLKTVLNIQGTYKGGSFGTRLRVTIP